MIYMFLGKVVCVTTFFKVHRMAKSTFYDYLQRWEGNLLTAVHGLQNVDRRAPRSDLCGVFLRHFVSAHCDYMPHKKQRHLPSCMTLLDVYDAYKAALGSGFVSAPAGTAHTTVAGMSLETEGRCPATKPLSFGMFKLLFKQKCPDVRIPKVRYRSGTLVTVLSAG